MRRPFLTADREPELAVTLTADDRRLVVATLPVVLLFALFFSHIYTRTFATIHSDMVQVQQLALEAERARRDSGLYRVLVEQEYRPDHESDHIRALSDVTAAGEGGITAEEGFHTLTPYDEFRFGMPQAMESFRTAMAQIEQESARELQRRIETDELPDSGRESATAESAQPSESRTQSSAAAQGATSAEMRIPANYRFRDDFALRYDQSRNFSIAREELAGYQYFRNMMRQIRDSFAPPGYNFAYRDRAGVVVNQPIKPQGVKVLFMLDEQGNVRDVRIVESMGQQAVDQACYNALAGQNFGPPPPEVLAQGNIFGINFIFPAVFR